ncbi:hypothetical protein DFH06DRAFT_1213943 [Mycena polygramma]|nr:hypothetical protein DFH06DRAFT_1213943 [Mycena polygramma]
MPGIRRHVPASHIETPYKDYLHTNFVPSEEECGRIRDLVAPKTQELDETTVEITQLQASLDRMVRKRDQLEEFIDSHLALVSGARRLPHDILTEIFMASLPHIEYYSMTSVDPPLLLCHICREWRNLALCLPRLWASLQIGREEPSYDHAHRHDHRTADEEGVKSWLTRSGRLPLSISSVSTTTAVLEVLLEYAPRWEHIRFKRLLSEHLPALAQLSPEDVPLLKTAVIEASRHDDESVLSFISAPTIRRLSLRNGCFGLRGLTSALSVSHISLRILSSVHALDVLRHCPMLETCTLQTYNRVLAADLVNPIRLERMQRFCLNDQYGKAPLLHCIVLPNLRSLDYSNELSPDNLEALLTSLCIPETLTDLRLSIPIETDQLLDVLRHFPMLETVCLHRPRESLKSGLNQCSLFALLTPTPTSSVDVLCPRLKTICSLGLDVGSDKELLALIDMRFAMDGIQPLSAVHVAFARPRQLNILPLLPADRDDLAIDLRYPDAWDKKLLIKPWVPRQVVPIGRSTIILGKMPPAPLRLQSWRQDPDVDWAPISGEWLAEYDEWGPAEEEPELGPAPEQEQEASSEDDLTD